MQNTLVCDMYKKCLRFYFLKVENPSLSLDIRSLILSIMSYVVYTCTSGMYIIIMQLCIGKKYFLSSLSLKTCACTKQLYNFTLGAPATFLHMYNNQACMCRKPLPLLHITNTDVLNTLSIDKSAVHMQV